ncbi:hypothetical protein BC826DRAFT_1108773 [Russula brevipes]|nr:hypothetical protein BC826DRAFT_1108773 [Russula brevipes]
MLFPVPDNDPSCHGWPLQSTVDQWIAFVDAHTLILQLVKGIINPDNKPIHNVFQNRLTSVLTVLEKHPATRKFLERGLDSPASHLFGPALP